MSTLYKTGRRQSFGAVLHIVTTLKFHVEIFFSLIHAKIWKSMKKLRRPHLQHDMMNMLSCDNQMIDDPFDMAELILTRILTIVAKLLSV